MQKKGFAKKGIRLADATTVWDVYFQGQRGYIIETMQTLLTEWLGSYGNNLSVFIIVYIVPNTK